MQTQDLINYWIEASNIDFRAMNNLYSSGDYVWALFIGHLVIEKLLKALAVKNKAETIPRIHDLNKLAISGGIEVEENVKDLFDIITSFNIEARYPDFKQDFYKKCDRKFTTEYITRIKDLRKWLLEQLNL
ncbi:MAG: HEPN domain-containing protein [Ignavibacteria bacterium]|jgi:HEPN domain-containing protein